VVLVHGTYAPRAAWTRPDSKLCQLLIAALGENTLFHRFDWDGRNSFRARKRAAIKLEEELTLLFAAHPHAKIVVIAHSHGGKWRHSRQAKGTCFVGSVLWSAFLLHSFGSADGFRNMIVIF
jgi:hypothetical protein